MAKQLIDNGATTPDSLYSAATKINANTNELFADKVVFPIKSEMSWWTHQSTYTDMSGSYFGNNGRIACYKFTVPFPFTVTKIAHSESTIQSTGDVYYYCGLASLTGTILGYAGFAPSAADLAPALNVNVSLSVGQYYIFFGGNNETGSKAGRFRTCIQPNYTNFATGYSVKGFAYATTIVDNVPYELSSTTTLGTLSDLTGGSYFFPQFVLIGSNA
jgi:hypothetical protein